MSGRTRIAGIVCLVVVAAAFVGVWLSVAMFGRSDRIARNVSVANISVGGLSRSEVRRVLDGWWSRRQVQQVTLIALDSRRTLTLKDIGAEFDCAKAVHRAYALGREGGLLHKFALMLSRQSAEKQIEPTFVFPEKQLVHAVRSVANSVNKPHKDASLRVVDGRFKVEPEQLGIKVQEARALDVVRRALLSGQVLIPLPVDVDRPQVTTADVGRIDTLLSSYTTQFNPGKRDRTHNLKLATQAVNGVILKPGQVFSYNARVGPREINTGYRNAPIFVRGNLEPGIGGGICQVSSTIYNAVLLAGLRIRERSHHSRTVPYVRPGRDATVAYGLRDLKFENTNANPIGLIAVVKGSLLNVYIYGHPADKKQVKVTTSGVSYSAAATKTVQDPTMQPGVRKVVDHGSPRVSVVVYRKLIASDGRETTEVVSRDVYPAQPRIVAEGPKAKPVPPPSAPQPVLKPQEPPEEQSDGPVEDAESL